MIIGFCGYQRAGKDTAAAYLIKEFGFERRAFADPLKKSVAALLDIPFWEVDEYKLDELIHIDLVRYDDNSEDVEIIRSLTMRHFLQRYGTESHRETFYEDFWLDLTLPVDGFYAGRKIVITDVRFQNEVDRVHEVGGKVVRIIRPSEAAIDTHISDQASLLEFIDTEIVNDDTLDRFYQVIGELLNR